MYELSSSPTHSPSRFIDCFVQLDSIIEAFGLTFLDADQEDASVFVDVIPTISPRSEAGASGSGVERYSSPESPDSPPSAQSSCSCGSLTISAIDRVDTPDTFMRTISPGWDPSWDAAEIQREELRRLCWGSLVLLMGYYILDQNYEITASISCPSQVSTSSIDLFLSFTNLTSFFSMVYSFPGRRSPNRKISTLRRAPSRHPLGPLMHAFFFSRTTANSNLSTFSRTRRTMRRSSEPRWCMPTKLGQRHSSLKRR